MKDFLLDENDDLAFDSGDLAIGVSDLQNKKLLLLSDPGDWKESPLVGISAASYLKDDNPEGLLAEVKRQFEMDGMKVNKIGLTPEGNLTEDANY